MLSLQSEVGGGSDEEEEVCEEQKSVALKSCGMGASAAQTEGGKRAEEWETREGPVARQGWNRYVSGLESVGQD